MKFLSWGCGVQSTTVAAMSALGELEPLDAVIHADAQWESAATVAMRDWYTDWLRGHGLHIEIVTAGDIRCLGAEEHIHIPFWTQGGGPLQRQCTRHFKVMPVRRAVRNLLGFHERQPPHPPAKSAEVWLGISLDEWKRADPSRVKFIVHRWPLLERRMTRQDCIDWLISHNLPVPPKSACICCPYRRASEWLELRAQSPQDWEAACKFDEAHRHKPLACVTSEALYLWRDCEPLRTADLEAAADREIVKFGGAIQIPFLVCESGRCWV
jgi:hypothetical protein